MAEKKKKTELSFQDGIKELETLAESLESESVDLDDGVKKFERGLEIIADLKSRLKKTEATIREVKTRYRDVLSDES